MKRFFVIVMSVLFIMASIPYCAIAADEVTVVLDGNLITFDVPAQIIDGRTMVPMRKIFEELGLEVDWNSQTETVSAYKPGIFIELSIGSFVAYRNTIEQHIDVPAQIINARTLVPVRVVSEYAGADVDWKAETNTVYIKSTDSIQYIDWNDNYEYYGEVKNGKATGYGILYEKNDNSIAQLGKYVDSKIVVGTDYFDNGDIYRGNYENAAYSYGTYYYADGSSYTGEFKNSKKHGDGIYNYTNGSFHKGKWENDLPNGYGIFYDAVEDVQYQGNYVNGSRDGNFIIDDFYENKTYRVSYNNTTTDEENIENTRSAKIAEYYKKVEELEQEYKDLGDWYKEKMNELYDYIQDGDPFSTDWAKSIYESYGVTNGTSPADSNLDSFAVANAARQRAALKAKADSAILNYNSTYISTQRKLIEDTYNSMKKNLDSKKKALETEKEILGL